MIAFVQHCWRKIVREVRIKIQKWHAQRRGILFLPPNFVFWNQFGTESIVIDVGCGADPELARFVLENTRAKVVCVDPTRKHSASLEALEKAANGRLRYLPYALAEKNGTLQFHESLENVSGSLFTDHTNVRHDDLRAYDIRAVTLEDLFRELQLGTVDLLKLDLEGAEYALLGAASSEALGRCKQVFVEFHHHCVDRFGPADTAKLVQKIQETGFEVFSLDRHNYLFFQ